MPNTATAPMTRVDPDRNQLETWADDTTALVLTHLRATASSAGQVDVSHREAAAALRISPATVRRAIHTLLDDGDLHLVRRGTGGRHRSRYRITTHAT